MTYKPTVIIDFDGVIHSYPKWRGIDVFDPPTKGAREALIELRKQFKVKILSTRCIEEAGFHGIQRYMIEHDLPHDGVIREKEKAVLMIDDRGYRFDGNWSKLLEFIQNGAPEPWNRSEEK